MSISSKRMLGNKIVVMILAVLLVLGGVPGLLVPGDGKVYAAEEYSAETVQDWGYLGSSGFSEGAVNYTSVAFDTYGTPYVAYSDVVNENKATVMKYDGEDWENVGSAGFSAGGAGYTSVTVDTYGTPYVAYSDVVNENKATVMKYYGENWVNVGDPGFSAGIIMDTSVTVDTYGTPYLAYSDVTGAQAPEVTVKKYNGSTWESVGGTIANGSNDVFLNVASGILYVAFRFGNTATVKKYNGSTWETVGDSISTIGNYTNGMMSFSVANGIPYVALVNADNKVVVMKYNGSTWETVGAEGFSDEYASYISLYVDGDTPYVAYSYTVKKYNGSAWEIVGSDPFQHEISIDSMSLSVFDGIPYLAMKATVIGNGDTSRASVLTLLTVPPDVALDMTDNYSTNAIEVYFVEDAAWSANVIVKDGEDTLTAGTDYTIDEEKITFGIGKLAIGTHALTIKSSGYLDTVVVQDIKANPNLSGLTLSDSTLSPVFASGTTSYTASVTNSVYSLTVTPTVADSIATVTVNGEEVTSGSASDAISLDVGSSNTVTVVVTAQDDTTKSYTVTVTRAASNNANLSDLTLSSGTLAFDSGTSSYTASVGNDVNSITVTPTVVDSTATVTVNGMEVMSGSASEAISLDVGSNTVTVVVTAQDGTTKTYTVTVTRAASNNADLSDLTLSSGTLVFDSGTTSYTASVGNDVNSITVTPTVVDSTATVTLGVNGGTPSSVESGSASEAISLNVGSNTVTVVVTAQDGTTKTYTVTVTRAASSNANLSDLTLSSGTLAFDSGTTSYTASVGNDVNSITVTPTVVDSIATVTLGVNGGTLSSVESGSASEAISLNVGSSNIVTIVVTAQDDTTKTYTVTVTRAASSNANLSDLTLSSSELSPVFTVGATEYTSIVSNDVSNLTVAPTVADSNATVTVNGVVVTSGAESGEISLDVGSSNTIKIVVTAQDDTTKTYTVTVTRAPQSPSDNEETPITGSTNQPSSTDLSVTIDGEHGASIATAVASEEDGQTVLTATIDSDQLVEQMANAEDNAVVTIPVTAVADKVSTVLTGNAVKAMENKHAVLDIQTPIGSYKLPASEVKVDLLAMLLGGQASDSDKVAIHVDIAKSNEVKVGLLWDAANLGKFTIAVPPVDFTVTATLGDKSVTVNTFDSYVEREIPLPSGIDASMITAAVVLNEDGTTRSVPMKIVTRDGKSYAVINSLTNSTYALISNPIQFQDVANHWAKKAVNDMGSRMIISGVGDQQFNPDQDITRAEFAAIIVRGLGLGLEKGTSAFADVKTTDWYSSVVNTVVAHQLMTGYGDETFRPNDKITREEAMVVIDKAMDITNLKASLIVQSADDTLRSYADTVEVSTWALSSVVNSIQAGIISGRTSTELAPKANLTRAEVAVIVQRLLQKSKLI